MRMNRDYLTENKIRIKDNILLCMHTGFSYKTNQTKLRLKLRANEYL